MTRCAWVFASLDVRLRYHVYKAFTLWHLLTFIWPFNSMKTKGIINTPLAIYISSLKFSLHFLRYHVPLFSDFDVSWPQMTLISMINIHDIHNIHDKYDRDHLLIIGYLHTRFKVQTILEISYLQGFQTLTFCWPLTSTKNYRDHLYSSRANYKPCLQFMQLLILVTNACSHIHSHTLTRLHRFLLP